MPRSNIITRHPRSIANTAQRSADAVSVAAIAAHASLTAAGARGLLPAQGLPQWPAVLELAIGIAAIALGRIFFRHVARSWNHPPALVPLFLAVVVVTLVVQGVGNALGWTSVPPEFVILGAGRSLVVVMAAASVWPPHHSLTMLIGLFVCLFSLSVEPRIETQAAAGVFAVAGLAWLSLAQWRRLECRLAPGTKRSTFGRWPTVIVAGTFLVLLAITETGHRAIVALSGGMPFSGGVGPTDANARSGIGDGENLVAGKDDIRSFGPIENAPFLSSPEQSLYDVFNEAYNEPVRPRSTQRAIALPPEQAAEVRARMAKTDRATREFSTHRRSTGRSNRRPETLQAAAAFHLKGRVPLHLRLEAFDLFDGETWYAEGLPDRPAPLALDSSTGRPWITLDFSAAFDFFAAAETHAVKTVRLGTNRIPSPPGLRAVHIDQLTDPGLLAWAQPAQLRLDRERIPP